MHMFTVCPALHSYKLQEFDVVNEGRSSDAQQMWDLFIRLLGLFTLVILLHS